MLAIDTATTFDSQSAGGLLTSALRERAADQHYLKLNGLAKSFGKTQVFAEIEAEIARGEFITLLGPSGCGKSTLLNVIAGHDVRVDGVTSLRGPLHRENSLAPIPVEAQTGSLQTGC